MPIANVNITLLDGALGVLPSNLVGHVAVVAGPASKGPLLQPVAFARPSDIETNFGYGAGVELGCAAIGRAAKACVFVRTGTTSVGAYGAIDSTNVDGTCIPTADASVEPYDEYEPYVKTIVGGTIGVDGITYQWSLDGGRTMSATTKLGTDNSITFPYGNVKFDLAAGTLTAGDYWFTRTTGPQENASDFSDARTAIAEMGYDWDFATFATPMAGSDVGTFDTWLESLWAAGKRKAARLCARGPAVGESEATWIASLAADFSGVTSKRIAVSAGYCEFSSSAVGARKYRRPAGWISTARALKLAKPWRNDLGEVGLGNLGGDVKIKNAAGRKAGLHDESLDPGLDALGFETLTSLEGRKGAYVTTPRVLANIGSDYYLWQYVAVTNRAAAACGNRLLERCRKYIFVNKDTGYITTPEAKDINKEVESEVRNAVGDSVSAQSFVTGQTDNLLAQNSKMTGALRIVPLAYPAGFDITMGFVNPATGVTA